MHGLWLLTEVFLTPSSAAGRQKGPAIMRSTAQCCDLGHNLPAVADPCCSKHARQSVNLRLTRKVGSVELAGHSDLRYRCRQHLKVGGVSASSFFSRPCRLLGRHRLKSNGKVSVASALPSASEETRVLPQASITQGHYKRRLLRGDTGVETKSVEAGSGVPWQTLSGVVESGAVKKWGSLQVLDESKCILNDTSWEKVLESGPEWARAIEASLAVYKRAFRERLISVYVRGSVPRGLAIAGVSDLDMLAYVFQDPSSLPPSSTAEGFAKPDVTSDKTAVLQQYKAEARKAFPFLTGIEMRVLDIDPRTASGVVITQALKESESNGFPLHERPTSLKSPQPSSTHVSSSEPHEAPFGQQEKSLPVDFPGAFLVKAQSLRVWGLDLASLLPPETARPTARASPTLRTSLKRAISYGRGHIRDGDYAAAGTVYRWALKRCIRAGFEKVAEEIGWRVYTRDLYWCCHVAAQHRPALEPVLVKALLLCLDDSSKVGASSKEVENCFQVLGSAFGNPSIKGKDWSSVDSNREVSMLKTSKPDSLTRAEQATSKEGYDSQRVATTEKASTVPQAKGLKPRRWPKFVWRVLLEFLSRRDLEAGCVAAPLPLFRGVIGGKVQEYDWGGAESREAAVLAVRLILQGSTEAQPVILRGAGKGHPAVHKWTLDYLTAESSLSGVVRVAPDFNFMYCEETHPDVRSRQVAAPSRTVRMSVREFAVRSQAQLPPWASFLRPDYLWQGERYYMQASLTGALLEDLSLALPPFEVECGLGTQVDLDRAHPKPDSCHNGLPPKWAAGPLKTEDRFRSDQNRSMKKPTSLSSTGQRNQVEAGNDSQQDSGDVSRLRTVSASDRVTDFSCNAHAQNGRLGTGFAAPPSDVSGAARDLCDDVSIWAAREDDDVRLAPGGDVSIRGWALSQEPRLWMSPRGAVSPLHFDASPSCLLQVRGKKRMLLYHSRDLPSLYPYPDDHPLRRRAQVDPTAPDLSAFPAFAKVAAVEAVLAPGDVIFFPSRWAHYTESVDFSMSVSCRFVEAPC